MEMGFQERQPFLNSRQFANLAPVSPAIWKRLGYLSSSGDSPSPNQAKSEFQDRPQIKYPRIKHRVVNKQSHIVPKIHKEIKTLLIHSCGTPTNKDLGGKTDSPLFQLKEMPFHRNKVNCSSVLRQ